MTDTENTDDAPPGGAVTPALLAQLEATLCLPDDMAEAEKAARIAAARAMLAGIAPAGAIEAMLACQMVAAHEASMGCLARAGIPGAPPERIDRELRQGERLMALFARQVAALDRLRVREEERAARERRYTPDPTFLDLIAPGWAEALAEQAMQVAGETEDVDECCMNFPGAEPDEAAADGPAGDMDGGEANGSGAADEDPDEDPDDAPGEPGAEDPPDETPAPPMRRWGRGFVCS